MVNRTKILNIEFDNISEKEMLENLSDGVVVTPNVDHIMKLQRDREFYDIVKKSEWVVCDSKIIYFAAKLLGRSLKEAIPGSCFFPHFYMYHKDDEDCKIFLLGAQNDVADKAKRRINVKVGREIVVGAYSPTVGFEKKTEENEQIYRMINESHANVVLVGVGCPKQEKWINEHKQKMPHVKIWMALGATIDFEANNVKRAPKIFQKIAMEWLYRLLMEPRRMWKRYLRDDPPFFWLLIKEKLGVYKDPFANK
jgi:exopolysaccharide biosynthesis WecB/TagA/CpsF family protein